VVPDRLYERLGYRQEGYQPCQFYGDDFLVFGKVLEGEVEPAPETSRLHGAILIFPDVEELDFVGVYEVLSKARTMADEGQLALAQPLEVSLLAREQRVVCANGMVVQPHRRYAGLAGFDFVVVPGERGVQACGTMLPCWPTCLVSRKPVGCSVPSARVRWFWPGPARCRVAGPPPITRIGRDWPLIVRWWISGWSPAVTSSPLPECRPRRIWGWPCWSGFMDRRRPARWPDASSAIGDTGYWRQGKLAKTVEGNTVMKRHIGRLVVIDQ